MKKAATVIALLVLVIMTACSGKYAVENLFKMYSLKPGFELTVRESELRFDFALDSEVVKFINSVERYYRLSYDAREGNGKDYERFEKKLERIIEKNKFSTVMDLRAGGRLAAYYRVDKDGNINGFLFLRQGGSSSTWIWAPANKTQTE